MYKANNQGITLIELLIVLVISSFIISELFSVYLESKEHHLKNNALQDISKEVGFVNQLLTHAVRGAGYLGYSNWRVLSVYDNTKHKMIENFITIWNADDPELLNNIQKKIKPGTQAIELKQMNFALTSLSEKAIKNTSIMTVINTNKVDWKNKDWILIADTQHAEINQIVSMRKKGDKKSIQLLYPLYYSYDSGTYAGTYFDRIYFVGDTGRHFPDKTAIYGLYVNSEEGMTEEITDLVSNIHAFLENDQKLLILSMTLTVPYWVVGKNYSREQKFDIALRE